METLSLQLNTSKAEFTLLSSSGESAEILFTAAPNDFFIGGKDNKIAFYSKQDIRTVLYEEDGKIILVFNKDILIPCAIPIKLNNFSDIKSVNSNYCTMQMGANTCCFNLSGGNLVINEDRLSLSMTDNQMILKINLVPNKADADFSSLSVSGYNFVYPGQRIPEFSIGIFDDYSFTRPRMLRLGNPVISTVPSPRMDGVALTDPDAQYLSDGNGPDSRVMFFKVVCNRLIEPDGTTVGNISAIATLKIALPNGIDTVSPPVSVPLTYQGKDVSETQDIYSGFYEFHREDTVNYVDGLCYLSVYMPLTVQSALPMVFRVSGTDSDMIPPSSSMYQFSI